MGSIRIETTKTRVYGAVDSRLDSAVDDGANFVPEATRVRLGAVVCGGDDEGCMVLPKSHKVPHERRGNYAKRTQHDTEKSTQLSASRADGSRRCDVLMHARVMSCEGGQHR